MDEPSTSGHVVPVHYAAPSKTLIETASKDILKTEAGEAHEVAQQMQ